MRPTTCAARSCTPESRLRMSKAYGRRCRRSRESSRRFPGLVSRSTDSSRASIRPTSRRCPSLTWSPRELSAAEMDDCRAPELAREPVIAVPDGLAGRAHDWPAVARAAGVGRHGAVGLGKDDNSDDGNEHERNDPGYHEWDPDQSWAGSAQAARAAEIRSASEARPGAETRVATEIRPGAETRVATEIRPPAGTRIARTPWRRRPLRWVHR